MAFSIVDEQHALASGGAVTTPALSGLADGDLLVAFLFESDSSPGTVIPFAQETVDLWYAAQGASFAFSSLYNTNTLFRPWRTGDPTSYHFQSRAGISSGAIASPTFASILAIRGATANQYRPSLVDGVQGSTGALVIPATANPYVAGQVMLLYFMVSLTNVNAPSWDAGLTPVGSVWHNGTQSFQWAYEVVTAGATWPTRTCSYPTTGNSTSLGRIAPTDTAMS